MKKLFSLLLALSLLTTLFPTAVAEETWICPVCGAESMGNFCPNDAQPKPGNESIGVTDAVQVGDIVTFGNYPQGANDEVESIEWLVLEVSDGSALLISRYLLAGKWINFKPDDQMTVTWEESSLRNWLNSTFMQEAFSNEEQTRLVIIQADNSSAQGNPAWKGGNGPDTQDTVTLLSYREASTLLTQEQRTAAGTAKARGGSLFVRESTGTSYWWLRSTGSDETQYASVSPSGEFDENSINNTSNGVRPVIRVLIVGEAAEAAAGPTAGSTATPVADGKIHITDFGDCGTLEDLFACADHALDAGEDPKQVGEELYAAAEANDILTGFLYASENIAAYENASYEAIQPHVYGGDQEYRIYLSDCSPYEKLDSNNTSVYEQPFEISDELKALLADSTAEYCFEPAFWSESQFKSTFGSDYTKFKPTKARAGFVCVIVKDSSQSHPDAGWEEDYEGKFSLAL